MIEPPTRRDCSEATQNDPPTLFCRLSRHTYFAILCLITALTSGGLVAGIGPFQTALVHENYFKDYNEVTSVFTGAFQIMTVWRNVFVVFQEDLRLKHVIALSLSLPPGADLYFRTGPRSLRPQSDSNSGNGSRWSWKRSHRLSSTGACL